MARDTVVLSPECVNIGRREDLAVAAILTGTFVEYAAGGLTNATAAVASHMIAVENVATAQELDYTYAIGETVFAQSLPRGTLVNAKAVDGTYNAGDKLEVGAAGELAILAAGVAVAVVPSFGGEVITGTGSLLVELI